MSGSDRSIMPGLFACIVLIGAFVFTVTHVLDRVQQLGRPAGSAALAAAKSDAAGPSDADQTAANSGGAVELTADRFGQFLTQTEVNGLPVDSMIDTGANKVALTFESAERAGIFLRDRDFTLRTSTANGTGRAAPVMLDRVTIGSITVHNVEAMVTERGALRVNLIGMSFLKRLQRVEVRSGRLVLQD